MRALSRSHANAKSLTHKITCRKTQTHLNEKAHIHRSEQMIYHKFTSVYIHLLTQPLTHLFMICKHLGCTTHGTTEKYF